MRQGFAIACISLVVGAGFLLGARPAAAYCWCHGTVYNTGTQTGTGSTCAAAKTSLESLLQGTASANCSGIWGDYFVDLCNYSETLNACQACTGGYMQTGSAKYQCYICVHP